MSIEAGNSTNEDKVRKRDSKKKKIYEENGKKKTVIWKIKERERKKNENKVEKK